jgi:hypothetical protein
MFEWLTRLFRKKPVPPRVTASVRVYPGCWDERPRPQHDTSLGPVSRPYVSKSQAKRIHAQSEQERHRKLDALPDNEGIKWDPFNGPDRTAVVFPTSREQAEFQGGGGSFAGAGASGSWDEPTKHAEPSPSHSSHSHDTSHSYSSSSSSDSGSSYSSSDSGSSSSSGSGGSD